MTPPDARRRPWWPAIASAACLAYFTLLVSSDLRRPEPLGMRVSFSPDGMHVTQVEPGSPAERAGLVSGDRIVRMGVVTVFRRIDALAAETHFIPDAPTPLLVDRGGVMQPLTLVSPRATWRYWIERRQGASLLTVRAVQFITLVLACVLLAKRPGDLQATLGAWLLATVAVFSVTLPYGMAEHWVGLPQVVGVILFVPYVASVSIAAVAFTFFAAFPRPLIRGARIWAIVWTPMLAGLAWHAWYGWHLVYAPERVHVVPDWSRTLVAIGMAYGIAVIAALAESYRRLADVNDRRRLKVLMAGSLVGCLAGGPVAVLYWMGPGEQSGAPLFSSPLASLGALTFLAMPLSFAYAILRHRLFDVSLIVRRGLQYALARRVLVSAVPALAVLLAIDLLVHGDRPLIETIQARGAIYLAIGIVAIAAHGRREAWLGALDRRFFRERYNAQQILRRIVEDIRTGGALESIAERLAAQVSAALHPVFAAVLVRPPGGSRFEPVAVSPQGRGIEPLDGGTRLVALVGVLQRPADVSPTTSAWMRRELPQAEETYLTRNAIELIVPAGEDAMLALGGKHSEEPYSSEDADLLAAIGESLALRLTGDTRGKDAQASRLFEECPECGSVYDSGTANCQAHRSTALRTVAMPRVLANRYRLERRLGYGGMGMVYSALDTALSRRVAAKVLRDELVNAPEAEERFHREARLAASLTHPNVITVYDFGVFANRAFLVMELLEGMTLRDLLRTDTTVPRDRAVEILRGVSAAVDAAHALKLVHRDLKPENVFLSRTARGEVVKVLDFGVAKTLAAAAELPASPALSTADGVLLGTLPYIAPEQLRGEPVSAQADLWAIAVIAHELLLGRHPFAHGGSGPWPAPLPAPPGDSKLDRFFARALASDPAARHPSASALMADLEQAVAAP